MKTILLVAASVLLGGCMEMPASVAPVKWFEIERYLGRWYEIASLDHRFESGLEQVTAEYTMRQDGGVHVKNRGFSRKQNQWKEVQGKACFVGPSDQGYLKVSFFGPFYGSYVVFELDRDAYQYAFVCGPKTSYLWLLARTPTVAPELMSHFIDRAGRLCFDTEALVHVNHQ